MKNKHIDHETNLFIHKKRLTLNNEYNSHDILVTFIV